MPSPSKPETPSDVSRLSALPLPHTKLSKDIFSSIILCYEHNKVKEAPPIVEMRWGNAHGEGTASRGKWGNKTYFPLQKREGGDGNGSHQGRMCCYLATQTIAIRHYVWVYGTPASVALPGEIVNCCRRRLGGYTHANCDRSKPLINTRVILRISADKWTIAGVSNVSSRKK